MPGEVWRHHSFDTDLYVQSKTILGKGKNGTVYELNHKHDNSPSYYVIKILTANVNNGDNIQDFIYETKKEVLLGKQFASIGNVPYKYKVAPAVLAYFMEWDKSQARIHVYMENVDSPLFYNKDKEVLMSGWNHIQIMKETNKQYNAMNVSHIIFSVRMFTLVTGFFHGDFHGNNYYVIVDRRDFSKINKCVVIDFGMSQTLYTIQEGIIQNAQLTNKNKQTSLANSYNPETYAHLKGLPRTWGYFPSYRSIQTPSKNKAAFAPNSLIMMQWLHISEYIFKEALHIADSRLSLYMKTYYPVNKIYMSYKSSQRKWSNVNENRTAQTPLNISRIRIKTPISKNKPRRSARLGLMRGSTVKSKVKFIE